jgi:hypothetical protein
VVSDVDCGTTCIWDWISTQYHELIARCDGTSQQIWLLDQPLSEHDMNLLMQLQWVELHQWGPMVETLSIPEKGCGQ